MQVLIYPHPVLRRGGKEVQAFGPELRRLADEMLEAMYVEGGVGLAAPQVGIEQKLLVLNPTGSKDDRAGELVIVNPKITWRRKLAWGEEGCLSFPGINAEVERNVHVTVSYRDLEGKEQEIKASDWLARIMQHELDHLEGVLFTDRLSPADKIRVRPLLEDLERRYKAPA